MQLVKIITDGRKFKFAMANYLSKDGLQYTPFMNFKEAVELCISWHNSGMFQNWDIDFLQKVLGPEFDSNKKIQVIPTDLICHHNVCESIIKKSGILANVFGGYIDASLSDFTHPDNGGDYAGFDIYGDSFINIITI